MIRQVFFSCNSPLQDFRTYVLFRQDRNKLNPKLAEAAQRFAACPACPYGLSQGMLSPGGLSQGKCRTLRSGNPTRQVHAVLGGVYKT
jgi:hypothetical protein